jgi:OOP family OmpA-OmpF porin
MHRLGFVLVTIALGATSAAAEPTQLGAWFGPRIFSTDSLLGYIDNAPGHPVLQNSVELGLRVARPFFPWLVPELEVGIVPTNTNALPATAMHGGVPATDVFWMDPRLHFRFELLTGRRVQPFLVIGGGAPIALSSARKTFDSGIVGDGYAGAGVRLITGKGFVLRFDARVAVMPGVDKAVTTELDFGFGIELAIGAKRARVTEQVVVGPAPDKDNDGIPDATDKCPDRAEDGDGFEDLDGCPDIDNDLDRVLDIADRCPNVGETYNGYEDDDGCPDTVPAEVDLLRGTIEGLLYADGETIVRDSAQPQIQKIAKLMQAHPSIKVVLIGYTDNQEAKQFATTIEGQPPADVDALSADLSRARAEAVKQALVAAGVAAPRVNVEGRGAEEPVADNAKPKGRLANRRVEIKLFVPPR